VLLETCWGS